MAQLITVPVYTAFNFSRTKENKTERIRSINTHSLHLNEFGIHY